MTCRWSRHRPDEIVHPWIVSAEDFAAVQHLLAGRGGRHTDKTMKRTQNTYQLRGLLFCGICERRMQSHWIDGRDYYRCRFPQEYALANKIKHPSNVYLREDVVVPKLDRLLAKLFAPSHIEKTLDALVAAQAVTLPEDAAMEAARRQIAEADRRLARHRLALEAEADPDVVTAWIREEQAKRTEAQAVLRRTSVKTQRISRDELTEVIRLVGGKVDMLANADPVRKAKIYTGLGLRLTYHPEAARVLVGHSANQDRLGHRFVSEGCVEPLAYLLAHQKRPWLDCTDA
jgi:hypothetical protein